MERNEYLEQPCLEHLFSLIQNKNRKTQNTAKRQLPYFYSYFYKHLPDNNQEVNGGALDINVG